MLGHTNQFDEERRRQRGTGFSAHLGDLREKRRQKIAQRKQLQQRVRGGASAQSEGVMGKIAQMNGYNPEALCGEIIADLFIFLFQFCFNIPYLRDKMIYNEQLKQELAAQGDEPLRLVFQPDERGNLPELFPLGSNGEPDVEADPITDPNQINELIVRANGYTPRPSFSRGLKMAMDMHIEAMLGNVLSDLDRMRLHGSIGQEQSSSNSYPDPRILRRAP